MDKQRRKLLQSTAILGVASGMLGLSGAGIAGLRFKAKAKHSPRFELKGRRGRLCRRGRKRV